MLTGYKTTLPTDCLLNAGVLYAARAGAYNPIGVTDGAPDFDPGVELGEVMFDNRAPSRLKGLTRRVAFAPVFKGTLKELGPVASGSQIAVLEPGVSEAIASGVTTETVKPAGALFAAGDYLVDFRWIFERAGGGFAAFYAPLAIVRKWSMKGNDKKEAAISFEIEAIGDPVNDLSTAPYAIEIRTALPTGLPTTPAQLFAELSALGAMDLYVDATSPSPAVATVGAASITAVVDGTMPSGKRMTSWDSAINPGTGKHIRPSADFNSGLGANSDGLTLRGAGMELPGSVGYSGTGCHAEDTSITATTPGQSGSTQLKDYLQEYTAGLTWVFIGRFKNNSHIVQIGETSSDPDYAFYDGDHMAQMQAVADDPNMLGLSSDTATGAARSRVVVSYTQLPTTTKGYFEIKRVNRDIYQPFGGTGIADTGPALTGTRRTRFFGNGGFITAPVVEMNMAIPFKGRPTGAAWKLICDTAKAWWPDIYEDTRPSLLLFSGDSFPAGYYGPGQTPNIHNLSLGQNSAPALPSSALISFPLSGNTPWSYQWPFTRLVLDGDTSLRTRLGLHFEETLNGASQPENYFVHDWWRGHGSKWKSVIHNENYNNNANESVGLTIAADIAANWPSHADGFFDFLATVPWSTHNFGDGTGSWPGGQNPMLWVTAHPSVATQEYKQSMYREAFRFLAGGDPSTVTAYGVPSPDNVTLTSGSPTSNPTIQAVNWQKANLGGKTWTHSMILADGTSGTAVATVNSSTGLITRVAAGHCLRRSISNDGGQCLVDVTCT